MLVLVLAWLTCAAAIGQDDGFQKEWQLARANGVTDLATFVKEWEQNKGLKAIGPMEKVTLQLTCKEQVRKKVNWVEKTDWKCLADQFFCCL